MPRYRPRLKFTLRTFFVLVTICSAVVGYIGWQWRIVRERQAVREWIGTHGREIRFSWAQEPSDSLPWIRRMLGDREMWAAELDQPTTAELERVESAFPETKIVSPIGDLTSRPSP